ncbi:hypothetical protein HIM_03476 [Hirsutella minnesotensis 3608]|uniref:Uncharacterized protein n=1 Tax=Hirsutella minnesotensis 3608 TaxID=1043627 RepID=A0A0F7ZQF4_9HYPO|nr:hypothetical protein HIM_03476 [Hirsutella minnesotensis 3608]
MGITGLVPLLKSIHRPIEIKTLRGETLGVDAYGWLHRAAYCCALELGSGKPTKGYVLAALNRVNMLRHHGITPYMVFDGDYLPSKAGTEAARAKQRDERKKRATELLAAGKRFEAELEFRKCVDITPEMASILIQSLKKMGVPYVVAPYEADAQLVYLERHGHIGGIISDDSDLLVFGAKRLFLKLDLNGDCIEINRRDFSRCREVSLAGWTDADFRRMCILSGCDYLPNLRSVGLKTAFRMLQKCKTPERVVRTMQWNGHRVSENYLTQFYQAEMTFLYHWVFCPRKKRLVHLTELDESRSVDELPFLGAHVEQDLARAIALGDVDPITKVPFTLPPSPSKRRHSQTEVSRRPSLMEAQRKSPRTKTQAAVEMAPKPIRAYFKGSGRIPMAEMDANCFAVDPEKISQITHGGLVPRVFPLPRPYLPQQSRLPRGASERGRAGPSPSRPSPRPERHRAEPRFKGPSSPCSNRRSPQTALAETDHSLSAPQARQPSRPQKKARLCGESHEDGSPKNSKFFPPSRSSPKQSISEAYLRSDDSIEEALSQLPEFDGWGASSSQAKSFSIFHDGMAGKNQEQQTKGGIGSRSREPLLPAIDVAPSSSQPSDTPLRAGLEKFLLHQACASETPASSVSRRSSIFSVASTPSTAPSTANSRLTPLQRLGAKATNSTLSPNLPKPRRSIVPAFGKGLPVNPSFVPLPKVDLKEVEALNRPQGSEDQIVPESDAEDNSETECEMPTTRLDLSRFAYA